MSVKHWQDPTNLALGLWLAASPWVLGFQGERLAANSALALGVLEPISKSLQTHGTSKIAVCYA
jgi:hypothetical protein